MKKLDLMEKTIIIASTIFVLVAVATVILVYHNSLPKEIEYDEEWIIGKTKAEIVERYGEFHSRGADPKVERYEIKEDRHTIFGGTEYGTHMLIFFDGEGKAYNVRIYNNDAGG